MKLIDLELIYLIILRVQLNEEISDWR